MRIQTIISLILFMATVPVWADAPYTHDPKVSEELRIRAGLPNFFSKLKTKKQVRVAYLGGSITKAQGWRVKSFAWLEEQYPQVDFEHINAAVGGTGADFGVCRLETYVLSHQPDLVFVEYRVNGGGKYPERAFEGVVRRIWEANPETDICFVYTIGKWMTEALAEGKQTGHGITMETLANHYGIPSIDLGVEVVDLLKAGTLSFNVPKREEGKLWFTKDACHPTDEGHELYLDIIARSLVELTKHKVKTEPHKLPLALFENHYHQARFQPITSAKRSDGWDVVDVESDSIYTNNHFRTQMMLDKAIKTAEVGATLTVAWEGSLIVFTHIPQEQGIEVEVSIDGQPPETFKCDQESKTTLYARYFYLPEQNPGKHRATLTVTKLPPGLVYYAGQFLVLNP